MQGKVILVTGGARRVGAATCRRLHAQGANLVVHYRASQSEARALQTELDQVRPGSADWMHSSIMLPAFFQPLWERSPRTGGKTSSAAT